MERDKHPLRGYALVHARRYNHFGKHHFTSGEHTLRQRRFAELPAQVLQFLRQVAFRDRNGCRFLGGTRLKKRFCQIPSSLVNAALRGLARLPSPALIGARETTLGAVTHSSAVCSADHEFGIQSSGKVQLSPFSRQSKISKILAWLSIRSSNAQSLCRWQRAVIAPFS